METTQGIRLFADPDAEVRVVGAASYQDAIWAIVGEPQGPNGGRPSWSGQAVLEPEPTNPHDANAVRVLIEGQAVVYLDRETAARVQPAIARLAEAGTRVAVPVACRGGFELREGGRAHCGLVLAFDPRDVAEAAG